MIVFAIGITFDYVYECGYYHLNAFVSQKFYVLLEWRSVASEERVQKALILWMVLVCVSSVHRPIDININIYHKHKLESTNESAPPLHTYKYRNTTHKPPRRRILLSFTSNGECVAGASSSGEPHIALECRIA